MNFKLNLIEYKKKLKWENMINNILDTLYQRLEELFYKNVNIQCLLEQHKNVSFNDCLRCQSSEYYDSTTINYSCDVKKNIYILRYMVVHCTEIISILDSIDTRYFSNKESLNILVLGGGSGIDILAFDWWINNNFTNPPKINYTIIDKESWGDIFNILTSESSSSISIKKEYIEENTILEGDYDLVMMSYFMSELDYQMKQRIWTKIHKNKIILINDRSEDTVLASLKEFRENVSNSECKCFDEEHCGYIFDDKIKASMCPKIYKKSCGCVYYNDN